MQTLAKIIILLLLYSVQLSAQTVTFPDPGSIATKEWVLEQIAKSKDSINPVPPVIVVDSCKAGPQLLRVYAVTPTSLTAQFHGVDVFQIKWTVTKRLLVVASGEISPKSSVLAIPLPALASGEYTLKLQGINCTGSSSLEFTVPDQSGGGGVTPVPGGDLPPPTYAQDWSVSPSGDWQARFLTGRRIDLAIDDSGRVTDNFPDSYSGNQRYLNINGEKYNVFNLLQSKPIEDFRGLSLPPGSYYIQKIYAKASQFPDWNSVQKAWWTLVPDNATVRETVNTELLVIHKNDTGSDYTWHQPAFYPQFIGSSASVLSKNKVSGFKNQYSVSNIAITSKGATHIQDTGGYNDIAPEQKFTLAKLGTAGGNAFAIEEEFRQHGYNYANNTGVTKKLILTSEIGEELTNKGIANTYSRTNAFMSGYLQAFKERYPGITVAETGIYGEYGGVGNQGDVSSTYNKPTTLQVYRETLTSKDQARRLFEPSYNRFSDTNQSTYFSSGRFDVQNVLIRLYFQSLSDLNGTYFPGLLYTIEKMYLAAPDRKQIIFTWEQIQDLIRIPNHFLDITEGWRYKFTSPAGRLYVGGNSLGTVPPYIAEGIGFFSQLLTEGFVVWSGNGDVKNVPVEGNQRGLFGMYDDKGKWESTGSWRSWLPEGSKEWVDYGEGGTGMPAYYQNSNGGFPKNPNTAIDAFYVGAAEYAKIENRTNKAKYWVKLSTDGGKSWYSPSAGSRGLEVSDFEKPNYNTANPVVDISAQRLPIVVVGEGTDGLILIYYNTFKLPTETDNVQIEHKGKIYNIGELRGSKLHLINL